MRDGSRAGGAVRAVRLAASELFPGWWIAVAGAAILGLVAGLLLQAFGAYVVVLQRDLGWSATVLSAAYSLLRLESGLMGPLQGWSIDRYGPKVNMRAGVVMLGVGFLAFSQIQTQVQFFAAFVLMALGSSFAGIMPVSTTLVSWFRRKRARALSIALVGVSAGGMAVPLVALSLERWSWRPTAAASGVLVLVVGLALSRMFHHRPEDVGLTVDGEPEGLPDGSEPAASGAPDRAVELSARQALRTGAFWAISLGHASSVMILGTVMVHMVPHLTLTLGVSVSEASLAVLLVTVMQFTGLALGGAVGDRVDRRLATAACVALHGTGLLVLAAATSWRGVAVACVMQGVAWGFRGPLMSAMRADYFGRESYGKIFGLSSVVVMLGSMSGPLIAGVLVDRFGNYQLAFRLLALGGVIGTLSFALARRPRPIDRRAGFNPP